MNLLGELDVYLIAQGRHWQLADCLGAHLLTLDGQPGVRFAVWAPNASQVSVVGSFNHWSSDTHRMRLRVECGAWEIFIPGVVAGDLYKYDIRAGNGARLPWKADPLARQTELAPATASVVPDSTPFVWTDQHWMALRDQRQQPGAAISVYEVHLASWRHTDEQGSVWRSVGPRLIAYALDMGFTHIELLPINEHPFGGSWGYQPLGMFAPTARYGTPAEFAGFVDACHQAGLGLILDWVPAHFPSDPHGLAYFDGTALYEHADPQQGWHPDWDTMIYNMGRNEVRNFLLASALEWLERYHVDGLRVDAVASMLYLDYSREPGQWTPNRYGGRENLEAISFFRQLNQLVAERCPGAITIAEESTAWPGVTAPTQEGGLGFNYKWNMGWMHDSLRYMQHDPIHRRYHHNDLTFSMIYAYSERFVLPLSHDEVVHGKQALLEKMPGDRWQKFANLRAYYGFMWCHPGNKLLFMGGEIAQSMEWDHDAQLNWDALVDPWHVGMQTLVKDLNHLYRRTPALHANDFDPSGFQWVIADDPMHSVFAFVRRHGTQLALVVVNMTPVPRSGWEVGVPVAGSWREVLNTDAVRYGGTNLGNMGMTSTTTKGAHGQAQSLTLTLPPLATLILIPEGDLS
ncbi:MAG: 1,4-alpha-glucan branching protein GlgB [Burkholderiaceae bacterium]|nr:1,4-alpha-glucan branching protein GlgB [Burkholderiaceae bacterium]